MFNKELLKKIDSLDNRLQVLSKENIIILQRLCELERNKEKVDIITSENKIFFDAFREPKKRKGKK